MGLFDFFKRSGKQEKRELTQKEIAEAVAQALTYGGLFTNNGSLSLSAVYSALEIISNSIAQLPIIVSQVNDDDTRQEMPSHPVAIALHEGLLTKFTLMKMIVHDIYLSGNAYVYIKRASTGDVVDLVYLQPNQVNVFFNETTHELYYTTSVVGGHHRKIQPHDMLHFIKNSVNGVEGKSLLTYAKRTINLCDSTEEAAKSFYSNGCNLNGLLQMNGPSTEKQRQDILNAWMKTYGSGSGNHGGVAVIPNQMTYQSVQANAADSQLLEARQFNLSEVARYFCISPVLLQDLTHSSYSTIEASTLSTLVFTLQPVISLIEHEMNKKLINENEHGKIVINIDESYFIKSDKSVQASYYTQLVKSGLISRNEARKQLGFAPINDPECDKLIIPYTDLSQNIIGDTDKAEADESDKADAGEDKNNYEDNNEQE